MAEKNTTTKAKSTAPKKPVTPREDPVVKAERILAEARAKAKAAAEKNIEGARGELSRAENQLNRWTGLRDRAAAKVKLLEERAGIASTENDAQSYADAISDSEPVSE